MLTFKLLAYFLPKTEIASLNPIFVREATRPPFWQHALELSRPLLIRGVIVVLVFLLLLAGRQSTGILGSGIVCILFVPLLLLMPSLLFVIVPVAVVLAPVIAREREQGTWETLQTTPFPTEALLLNKAAGALWWLRTPLHNTGGMMVATALIIGLVGLLITTVQDYPTNDPFYGAAAALLVLIMIIGGPFAFLFDRAQQFTLIAAAALGVSSSVRTLRDALPRALIAVSLIWLADIAIAAAGLLLQPGQLSWPLVIHALILVLFGPIPSYLIELPTALAALIIGLTLLMREIVLRGVWRWTLNAARAV